MPQVKKNTPERKVAKPKKYPKPTSVQPVKLSTTPVAEFVMPKSKEKRLRKWVINHRTAILIVMILIGIASGPSIYFYGKYQESQLAINNPAQAEKNETQKLIGKVGKHIVLPEAEDPVVAKINDINQFSGQSFFVDAQNDDRVLVYAQAKRAILYRPSIDRVINMLPLAIETNQ